MELKVKIYKIKYGTMSNLIFVIKWHFLMVHYCYILGDLIIFNCAYKAITEFKGT
jgi:hypothetical protein